MPHRALRSSAAPEAQPRRPIRLLIVDDSAVARAVFARIIGARPDFEIAATVSSAEAALCFLASTQVDIILLDIEMPGKDGLSALPALLAASNGARVLIVSSAAEEGATATMQALALGAADTLAKPGTGAFAGRFGDVLAERLSRLGHAPAEAEGRAGPLPSLPKLRLRQLGYGPVACVAIGASTGGLHALSDLLKGLPQSFDAPILITQHLPPIFMSFFAAQIQEMAGRPAAVADDGMALAPGRILIAPGDGHLTVQFAGASPRVRITRQRVESGCMPSVDPMFVSVAETFGTSVVGVVLSGMGKDGLRGAEALARASADLLAQNRDSSVVWGMPGAVALAGLASAILSPSQIAEQIARRGRARP